MNDLPPLPDDIGDLLQAERDFEAPAASARLRMLARLEGALPLPPLPPAGGGRSDGGDGSTGGPPDGAPPTGSPGVPGGSAAGALSKAGAGSLLAGARASNLLLGAVCLALGAAGGATTHAALSTNARMPSVARVVITMPVTLSPSAPAEPIAIPTPADPGPSALPLPSASAPSAERSGDATQLKAERLLLEAARTAITRGDHESARRALERHAASFPKGQLAEEREVLMVQVLRASGDETSARRRAAEFDDKFPGSLMRDAVDQTSRP